MAAPPSPLGVTAASHPNLTPIPAGMPGPAGVPLPPAQQWAGGVFEIKYLTLK